MSRVRIGPADGEGVAAVRPRMRQNLDRILTLRLVGGAIQGVSEVSVNRIRRSGESRAAAIERFTDELWAALRPALMPDPRRPGWAEEYLREVCEAGVSRLAADPRSQPMASRSLFTSARSLMTAQDQLRASQVIEAHFSRARAFFDEERGREGGPGQAPRCAALNRKGKPCGREPIWGTPFCVSHTARPRAATA